MLLLAATAVLGLGDLYATVTHMNHLGFIEANPFAEHLVAARSTAGLVLFKLGTLGIAAGLLLRTRTQPSSELAAWFVLGVMLLLTIHWSNYNNAVAAEMTGVDYQTMQQAAQAFADSRP